MMIICTSKPLEGLLLAQVIQNLHLILLDCEEELIGDFSSYVLVGSVIVEFDAQIILEETYD